MKRRFFFLIALCAAATPALAKNKRAHGRRHGAPPLMPSLALSPVTNVSKPRAAIEANPLRRDYAAEAEVTRPIPARQVFGIGAELGIAGRATNGIGSDTSLQYFMGGRVIARIPILEDFYLKPSAGFFYKSEGTGTVGLNQYVMEGGLTGQYGFAKVGKTRFLVGLANRLDVYWNTISSFGASASSPMFLQYRVGPAAGALIGLGQKFSLSIDAEATFTLAPVRPYGSLTAGFVYYWD